MAGKQERMASAHARIPRASNEHHLSHWGGLNGLPLRASHLHAKDLGHRCLNLNLWNGRALREHRRSSGSIPLLLAPTGKSILSLKRDGYLGEVGNGV